MMRHTKHAGLMRSTLVGVCLSAVVVMGLCPATASAQSNPIVIENQAPGTSA